MEPCHWSEGRHNNVGVSLRERRATMQVMLGVSLRVRWDATLVRLMFISGGFHFLEDSFSRVVERQWPSGYLRSYCFAFFLLMS